MSDPNVIAVVHDEAGRILYAFQGPQSCLAGVSWVGVDHWRKDWDRTHRVDLGQRAVVERDASDVAAEHAEEARRALRVRRDALLRDHVDSVNPMRWAMMSPADQAALAAYRQALLDLPQTTTDPTNPTWPTLRLAGRDIA